MANTIYQTPVYVIGGGGGSSFTYYGGTSGKILTKIGVWAGPWYLRAIRIWLTDSDPRTFGTASESYKEFTFDDGELITSLSLWGNGAGTRAGAIRFSTNKNREFRHQMTSWGLKQEYPIDVASGICLGVVGRHGDHIDSLGFVFLTPIASARMINLRYPTLDMETAGIVPETLDAFTDQNNATVNSKNWSFQGSREVKLTSSWSLTTGLEVHATITVQAGIPVVAEVQGEFGWNLSVVGNYTSVSERTRTLSWSQSGVLGPGEFISIQATTRRGTINIPYQATMEITLRSGVVFSYPLSGLYAGVDYTSVSISSHGTRKLVDEGGSEGAEHESTMPTTADVGQVEEIHEAQEWTLGY